MLKIKTAPQHLRKPVHLKHILVAQRELEKVWRTTKTTRGLFFRFLCHKEPSFGYPANKNLGSFTRWVQKSSRLQGDWFETHSVKCSTSCSLLLSVFQYPCRQGIRKTTGLAAFSYAISERSPDHHPKAV